MYIYILMSWRMVLLNWYILTNKKVFRGKAQNEYREKNGEKVEFWFCLQEVLQGCLNMAGNQFIRR